MKKSILRIAVFGLLAAAIAAAPVRAFSQEKKEEKPAAEPAKPKSDIAPFRGKVGAVDKAAMTFTVGERTFQVTSESKLTKAGKPATLADVVVGDEVGGRYQKTAEGKLVALSVRFGPRPEAAPAPETPEKKPEAK